MKNCIYCDGELKPVEDIYKQDGEKEYRKLREEFRKLMGFEMSISNKFNCIKCGRVYDENLAPTKHSIGWLKK